MNSQVELDDWIENPKAREDGNVDRDMYGLQPFHPLPAGGGYAMTEFHAGNSRASVKPLDVLLSRYRPVLTLIAYRVLCDDKKAEVAVENCIRVASDTAPQFDHEGAFRSWLARVLIDEAVIILGSQRRSTRKDGDRDCRSLFESANRHPSSSSLSPFAAM
jgi:DNA-directed RNA polymerase specialized sigma24 family protein